MDGSIFLTLVAVIGIDFGWQAQEDGSLEYIIQLDELTLQAMLEGEPVISEIHPDVHGIRKFRIQVGNGKLPRDTGNFVPSQSTPSSQYQPIIVPEPSLAPTLEPSLPTGPDPTQLVAPETTLPGDSSTLGLLTPETSLPTGPDPTQLVAPETTLPGDSSTLGLVTPETSLPTGPDPTQLVAPETTLPGDSSTLGLVTPETSLPTGPDPTQLVAPETTLPTKIDPGQGRHATQPTKTPVVSSAATDLSSPLLPNSHVTPERVAPPSYSRFSAPPTTNGPIVQPAIGSPLTQQAPPHGTSQDLNFTGTHADNLGPHSPQEPQGNSKHRLDASISPGGPVQEAVRGELLEENNSPSFRTQIANSQQPDTRRPSHEAAHRQDKRYAQDRVSASEVQLERQQQRDGQQIAFRSESDRNTPRNSHRAPQSAQDSERLHENNEQTLPTHQQGTGTSEPAATPQSVSTGWPVTLLGLFASLAANAYMGWITWSAVHRYRDLVDDVRRDDN